MLVLGFTVGTAMFNHLSDSHGVTGSESTRGMALLESGATALRRRRAVISGDHADAPRTRDAVAPAAGLTSSDGRTSIIAVVTEDTTDMMALHIRVDELRDLLHGSVLGATIQVGGEQSVMRDEMRTSQTDLVRGEAIALPVLPHCCSCSAAGAPPCCR